MGLSVEQQRIIKKLAIKYGEHITLGELLKIEDKTPIEEVKFNITGIYVYAYECTGDKGEWSGTIRDILTKFNWKVFKSPEVKVSELISDEELTELSKFFLGKRKDRCLSNVKVDISRKVTLEEIRDYIGNLEVNKEFRYESTKIEF